MPELTGRSRDDGFTLVELLVAIGVFGVLMAMVSVLMLNGLRAIRSVTAMNDIQAKQENALEVVTRQLRYIDNPTSSTPSLAAIVQATSSAMTFFTLSGTGTVDRLPYKVTICTSTKGLETFTWSPTVTNGTPVINNSPDLTVPACNDTGATGAKRRVLLPIAGGENPSVSFRYWRARTTADGAGTGDIELVPSGSLTTAQLALLTKVTVRMSDPKMTAPLEQTVVLQNDRS